VPQPWTPFPQARVLYHECSAQEAAGGTSTEPGGGPTRRQQLLREALAAAAQATGLNSDSLSVAALRATLAVNLLVEQGSSALGPTTAVTGSGSTAITEAGSSSSGGSIQTSIREELRGALAACSRALQSPNPTLVEPVISMNDGAHHTCDPCCMVSGWVANHFFWDS
jgi:hypothetical protein